MLSHHARSHPIITDVALPHLQRVPNVGEPLDISRPPVGKVQYYGKEPGEVVLPAWWPRGTTQRFPLTCRLAHVPDAQAAGGRLPRLPLVAGWQLGRPSLWQRVHGQSLHLCLVLAQHLHAFPTPIHWPITAAEYTATSSLNPSSCTSSK